jgi:hypothetical protein
MLGFILICFVAQVLFIVLFGMRRASTLKPTPFATSVHLVSDPWSLQQLAGFSELSDPALFALPSLDGFSRAGWLTYKPPPEEFAEMPHEPKWLNVDAEGLGRSFAAYVATNMPAPIRISDQSMPVLARLRPRAAAELEFPASELHIAGALAHRKLLTRPDLPSWAHTDVLTNSVVHLLVDADGALLSAALVSGSGLKEADNYAVAVAKRLRFKPERARETITSGAATFRWHTVPASVTNILSPGLTTP